jgi:hypothetical protein
VTTEGASSWLRPIIGIAARAAVQGPVFALVTALVIVTVETAAKLPASLLCGFVVGVFFAPVGIVERLGRGPRPGAARVVLAFALALLLALGLGLLADLQISYTTERLAGLAPEDAFARVSTRVSDFVTSPRSRLELLGPSVFTTAAVVAARAGLEATDRSRARRIALESALALTVCFVYLATSLRLLDSPWSVTARVTFSLFAVGIALVSPLSLALADRLATWLNPKAES